MKKLVQITPEEALEVSNKDLDMRYALRRGTSEEYKMCFADFMNVYRKLKVKYNVEDGLPMALDSISNWLVTYDPFDSNDRAPTAGDNL